MRNRCLLFLALLLVVLPMTGCFYSREIVGTKRDLERQYPGARFEREVVVSLGPVALRTLGWFAGLVPEEEAQAAGAYLRDIRRVKVGVYRTAALPSPRTFDPTRLSRFERAGWEVAVRAQEEDEVVWVLYRERRDAVRDLYVVVLNDEDLVLARLEGHLSRLLERVMADHAGLLEVVRADF